MSDRSHKRAGRAVRCSACGASYEDEAWVMLVLFQRIEPLELHAFIRDWPEDRCVEVRSCGACAHHIAAKRCKG
jgi:hypothetical protein